MNYLKFTPYLYLAAAAFFLYDGFAQMNNGEANYWLSFLIAGLSIFMFFFRRKYAKKFADRGNGPSQQQ